MPKSNLVQVRQNGDSGPIVTVSEAFAQGLGLMPISDDPEPPESPKSSARRRAAEPSHTGGDAALTPEEATQNDH